MKRILITGAGSYIGTSFEKWVSQWPDQYKVDTIDIKGNEWNDKSFRSYDVVYHIAAIVHIKENDTDKYFKVNRDLAIEVAKKAKIEGVRQFIFLSTMGVYGMELGFVDENTEPNPKTPYAESKLEAERLLNEISDDSFKISILRPPIVYGKDCRGNYPRLAKIASKSPIFPKVKNERSMIFIDNLSEFVRLIVDYELGGLFFPQNKEYVNTTKLVKLIAKAHGKELKATETFNPLLYLGIKLSETFGKVFGSFVYDKKMPGGPNEFDYEICSFEESVERTEK
ncbi:MAG: NAD-dependent epimerase/dehydratase family protein [Peptoclostridium sp.]|uniref:NAD-dependent epimerase/dehydratase family protein n=1 Tax=Peptoclostridium sp. TaxID=1904860 RepID=UPI00139B4947|nr:NAD-dependent epimerase/dehydratase family protein [Peptoclostridium sp.]MZQ74573.1 NAD-dependent epimerase/dehydratase family protein [Peptoclostridium sp.]